MNRFGGRPYAILGVCFCLAAAFHVSAADCPSDKQLSEILAELKEIRQLLQNGAAVAPARAGAVRIDVAGSCG